MSSSCSMERRLLYIYRFYVPKSHLDTCYELTIAKSKAWYQVVIIKSCEGSPYDGYSLFIWVWSISHCVQAPVVEGFLA